MNWKNLTIGKKTATGFGVVLVLLAVVGVLSFTGVSHIVIDATQVIEGNKLDGLLAGREVDHLNWVTKVNALLTDDKVTTLDVATDDTKCAFGKCLYGEGRQNAEALVPSLAPLFKEIEEPHRRLHESAQKIKNLYQQADTAFGNFLREKKTDHLAWAHRVKDVFVDPSLTTVNAEMDPRKCALGKWMYAPETEKLKHDNPRFASLWTDLEGPHAKLHESARTIQEYLNKGKREAARQFYIKNTNALAHECLEKIDNILAWHEEKVQGLKSAREVYAKETLPALQATQTLLHRLRDEAKNHIMTDEVMLNAAEATKRNVTIVAVIAIISGILLACLIARGITSMLQKISHQMGEGAEQVASAACQVASSSQSLAEGASEQAASLEETSSSLEEMSSMTKQNADNANQADTLMKEANLVVSKANESMRALTTSMEDISKASEETSKIIKTIDEIAFQTNLLALNAAVEAARAGEAGAGFAVVADEVRNLAMRAADAARNTADLIEGTVKKVNDGAEIVTTTNEAFKNVSASATKVGELVSEISAASDEQANGIEQVNKAVTEMDKVTQASAANAEESASASEEMNAQAEQMKDIVGALLIMVGGTGKNKARGDQADQFDQFDQSGGHKISRAVHKALPTGKKEGFRHPQASHQEQRVDPEQVIPLDDNDFKDF